MSFFDNLFNIVNSNYYGVSGLNLELNSLYIYNYYKKNNKNTFVLTNSLYEANELYNRILNYTDDVLFFPMDDFIASEAIAISPEFKSERINTLNCLIGKKKYIIVSNLMGVLRYLPNKKIWNDSIINVEKGSNIGRDKLINCLYDIGYQSDTIVTETGVFGIRGYVLDIFPINEDNPIRIEFWGDEIDSIKYFDVETQLSTSKVNSVKIFPYSEFLLDNYTDDIVREQKYLKYYSNEVSGIWDYLGDDSTIFYFDYNQIEEGYRLLRESILEYDTNNNDNLSIKTNYMYDLKDLKFDNEIFLLNFDNILSSIKLNYEDKYVSYSIDNYNGNLENIKKDLNKFILGKKTVILCVDSKLTMNRIIKYFDNMIFVKTNEDSIIENKINIIVKKIGNGFIINDYVVISSNDLFKTNVVSKKVHSKFKVGSKINSIDNISKGDYIVHESFGIGIYDDLCTLEKKGYKKDYIRLVYSGGDVLYIPAEKIDRISKFSDKDGVSVKLDSLGNDKWKKRKLKVRDRLHDIADSLIKVSAEREASYGFSFSSDDENQVLFDSGFEYNETSDQIKAIEIIKREMEKSKSMDMLLCGDVGYGKTEVAFRAMFKAVNDGKQVAYLCPTTILSNQQYNNALERFVNFPVNIALLNRFVSQKKQKEIISDLKNGKIDILFGTHRILGKDIEFKDLGLLVIDEEQRFGVTHKEKIKQYKTNVDVLTLSATPIPRTLQMSMSGVRSLSLIETPPSQRIPIQTYVLPENKNVIKDAIYKELSRNGQIFILYNYVDKIEDKVFEIQKLVPQAKICYAHGRMNKVELENIMQDFIDYKFDILICTTIIETGIDIPNVNTLIIIDADKFGLAQLYQIRGRIGRSDKIGYAYLMYDNKKMLNDSAIKRLNSIKEFTELGSGFKIAMRDLSIRGAGDILGSEQSGFIDSVGINLYLKMLKDEVDKIKGNYIETEEDENLDNNSLIDVSTHISDKYIDNNDLKIEIHKMINSVDSFEKYNEIKNEIVDRFGNIDNDIEIYMYEEWFEKLANKFKIKKVVQTDTYIDIEFPEEFNDKIDGEKLFYLSYEISKNFRLNFKNNKIHVILDIVNLEKHFLLYLIDLLISIEKTFFS